MHVSLRDIGDGRKEARIEVGWESIRADYDDLVRECSGLPVPGFRPGKAPRARVEGHYRKEILEDLTARSVRRLSRQALDAEGITSTGPIAITEVEVEPGEPFRFIAEFTALPEFDLPDYEELKLSRETDDEARNEISAWFLEETELDVPAELVGQELSFDGREGVDPGEPEWTGALQRVKLLLILDAIARRDGIEVDEGDLDERIGQIASAHGTDPGSLRQHLLQNGGLSRVSQFMLAERTLDYLIEKCRAKTDT